MRFFDMLEKAPRGARRGISALLGGRSSKKFPKRCTNERRVLQETHFERFLLAEKE